MANIVALVGRPNVGKSTLFNRLTQTRMAIVDSTAGVTRDRHYGKSDWNGLEFSVIDTGGYVLGSDDSFEEEIRKQVQIAIEEASVILFLVDVMEGVTPMDEDVADILRRSGKNVMVIANKADNNKRLEALGEFYSLGLGNVYGVSSINGSGTGDLLDDLVATLEKIPLEDVDDIPKFAVIGRPNVGKSSLINALTGQERNIVTTIAGTTRDSIYTRYNSFGFDFFLVDTAGLRKKGRVHENIEFYSVMRSIRAIENSDVCLVLIDAYEGLEGQDVNIFSLATRNNKGVVILVNKWDLIEKDHKTILEFEERIKRKIAPFTDVPIIFISVTKKQRVIKALEAAVKVYKNRTQKIPTSKLNELLLPIIEKNPPPAVKDKYIRIKYVTQLPTHYPTFAFFCNLPQYVRDSYERYLENQIRKNWDFTGVPIRIFFRKK
ncbi:MAG: ribosome biogenesis GTPase Der [Bacteroidales bacterium]